MDSNSKIIGQQYFTPQIRSEVPAQTAYQAIQSAPTWMKRIRGQCDLTPSIIDNIIEAIERQKLAGGGDGSVKKGRGSHGWELVNTHDY